MIQMSPYFLHLRSSLCILEVEQMKADFHDHNVYIFSWFDTLLALSPSSSAFPLSAAVLGFEHSPA
jgi:hypothetical protein